VGALGCLSISDEEKEKTLHVSNLPVSEAFLQNYLDQLRNNSIFDFCSDLLGTRLAS
jgi:hypothetical protein